MKIGIMGVGAVGSAIKYGFEKLGHDVFGYDIADFETEFRDVLYTDICYICVPTPKNEDGSCNVGIVDKCVRDLIAADYTGIIAIKSTVSPGTTQRLIDSFGDRICFVPEFLRERCAITDFMESHDVCIIGTEDKEVFKAIRKSHGRYPNKVVQVSPTEAEMCKYFNNVYNATLITFANSMFEVCEVLGANYTAVKEAMTKRTHIFDRYLDCNDKTRGFGGVCLPKDTAALDSLCKDLSIDVELFKCLLTENNKYETTVFEGMRKI